MTFPEKKDGTLKLAEMICTNCRGVTCTPCQLNQFGNALRLWLEDGLPLEEAYKRSKSNAEKFINDARDAHDRVHGIPEALKV